MERIEVPNYKNIRTLGEKENYKYLGIEKKKIRKEYLRRTKNFLVIKLRRRNLTKTLE